MRGVDCTRTTGYQGKDESEHSQFFLRRSRGFAECRSARLTDRELQSVYTTRSEVYQSPFSVLASPDHSQSTPEFDKVVRQSAVFSPLGENSLQARFDWFRSHWGEIAADTPLCLRSSSRGSLTSPPPPTNLPAGDQKGDQVLIQAKPPLLLKVCGISEVCSLNNQL